jgi:hypothetical protein
MRTSHVRVNGSRFKLLKKLRDAGGSVERDEFTRMLAEQFKSANAMKCCLQDMIALGLVQRRICLTASGSVRLAMAEDLAAKKGSV